MYYSIFDLRAVDYTNKHYTRAHPADSIDSNRFQIIVIDKTFLYSKMYANNNQQQQQQPFSNVLNENCEIDICSSIHYIICF